MRYCGSLYFLDSKSLNVKHRLETGVENFDEVAFSPNGKYMALVLADASWTWNNRRIRIYELETLTPVAEWPVTHCASHLTFTSDGNYLVSQVDELVPPIPGQKVLERKSCRMLSWATDTWRLSSVTTLDEGGQRRALDCPWRPRRIPGHNVFLDDGPVRVRDLRPGRSSRQSSPTGFYWRWHLLTTVVGSRRPSKLTGRLTWDEVFASSTCRQGR